MERPWGLSGPDFLALYAFALVMVCVVVFVAQWTVRQRPRCMPGTASGSLTLYEWAYLHGGENRVTDTAAAGLLQARKLRIDRRRKLYATVAPPEGDDFQQMIMEQVHLNPTLSQLRREMKRSDACPALVANLRAEGLLVGSAGNGFVLALWYLVPALGIVNIARYIIGAQLGHPVSGLVVEFLATLLAGALLWRKVRTPLRTNLGERLLKSNKLTVRTEPEPSLVRRDKQELQECPEARRVGTTAALSVAQSGISAHPEKKTGSLLSGEGGAFVGGSGAFFGGGDGGGGGCGGGGGGCGGGGA